MPQSCNILQFPAAAGRPAPKRLPTRRKNSSYRSREYLTETEVEALISAVRNSGRHGQRDATLIMLAYRHGLRVSELTTLRWEQVDCNLRLLHVVRVKHGAPSVHPLHDIEIEALLALRTGNPGQPYLFLSERGRPLTPDAVRKIVARAGREARLPFNAHPHMLRHACGYKLAQAGEDTRAIQDYLGHRNIQHTVRYTQLSSERFKRFWKD